MKSITDKEIEQLTNTIEGRGNFNLLDPINGLRVFGSSFQDCCSNISIAKSGGELATIRKLIDNHKLQGN